MGSSQYQWLDANFTSEDQHDKRVAALCEQMQEFDLNARNRSHDGKLPYHSPSDVPGLNKIIAIDVLTFTTRVECNMTMEALVQTTLAFGFLPSVVAGSRSATVSDAFAAMTSESSSFAFGTFDSTVTEIEVILGDGRLVCARPDDPITADLFYGSAGGLNSLGLITLLEVCLVRAGPYVELNLQPVTEASSSGIAFAEPRPHSGGSAIPPLDATEMCRSDAISAMEEVIRTQGNDFVEAMMFRMSSGVVIAGRFSPKASHPIVHKSQEYLRLVADVWRTQRHLERCMSTVSYLFRNMDYLAMQHSGDETSASHLPSIGGPAMSTVTMRRKSYGVPRSRINAFLQAVESRPIVIRRIMQPKDVGRRQSLGAAFPFEYEIDCCISGGSGHDAIEEWLLRKSHPGGFSYLQCRAPCQPGAAWVLHNDRWHVEPWLFHDDRWYVELRSRWKSEAMADISERVTCLNPLRFIG